MKDNTPKAELLLHSLLSFYSQTYRSERYITPAKSKEIITNFLKLASKNPKYKSVKSVAKGYIHQYKSGKDALKSIEEEYERMTRKPSDGVNDVEKFSLLLSALEPKGWIGVTDDQAERHILNEKLIISKSEINECFTDDGEQIKPIKVIANSKRIDELVAAITNLQCFEVQNHFEKDDGTWELMVDKKGA